MTNQTQARSAWMAVLATSEAESLERAWERLPSRPGYEYLRRPETGMVMVRARTGNTGGRFNLGEMTVTRCMVRLENGIEGFGYVAGRSLCHAELAAVFDAMLQDRDHQLSVMTRVIEPLARAREERVMARSRDTESTRVDFFTMTRGED